MPEISNDFLAWVQATIRVWFEHSQGPYCGNFSPDQFTVKGLREVYGDDPFFIGIQAPGEEPPPVIIEFLRHRAEQEAKGYV